MTSNKKSIFANNLRKLLKKNHISEREFATRMGVTYVNVSRWVTGVRYPNFNNFMAMLVVLNCSPEDLLEGVKDD